MTWSPEVLLAIAVPGLYLKDCLGMLDRQEAVLVRGLGGRWRAGFGAGHFALAGREPYVANPFAPHAPVVRLRWSVAAVSSADVSRPAAPAAASLQAERIAPARMAVLGALAWVAWLSLFAALPLALSGKVAWLPVAAPVALAYASVATALAYAWVSRRELDVDSRRLGAIAFECLACIPYGVNVLRKIAASRSEGEDFLHACGRLLDARALRPVRRECAARIDAMLDEAPDAGGHADELRHARARLEQGAADDLG